MGHSACGCAVYSCRLSGLCDPGGCNAVPLALLCLLPLDFNPNTESHHRCVVSCRLPAHFRSALQVWQTPSCGDRTGSRQAGSKAQTQTGSANSSSSSSRSVRRTRFCPHWRRCDPRPEGAAAAARRRSRKSGRSIKRRSRRRARAAASMPARAASTSGLHQASSTKSGGGTGAETATAAVTVGATPTHVVTAVAELCSACVLYCQECCYSCGSVETSLWLPLSSHTQHVH